MGKFFGIVAVCVIGLIGFITEGKSQELPNTKKLSVMVSQKLPGFWQLKKFRIVRLSQAGDVVKPRASIRYEADIVATKPLFRATGDILGIFPVVVSSFTVGQLRTLYGTIQLSYRAGKWSGSVEIENPVGKLGQPVDMFTEAVVKLGSERQSQLQKLLSSSAIQKLKSALKAKLNALSEKYKSEMDIMKLRRDRLLKKYTAEIEGVRRQNKVKKDELKKI